MTQAAELIAPPLPLPAIAAPTPTTTTTRLRAPALVRAAGAVTCAYGALMLAAIVVMDGSTLRRMQTGGELLVSRGMIGGFAGAGALLAALLLAGGILLLCGRRAGRGLALVYVWAVGPIMAIGAFATAIAADAHESHVSALLPLLWFHAAAAGLCALVGLVLGIFLLTGPAARWADASAKPRPATRPGEASSPRISIAALVSLIFVFLPPPLIMQMVSLGLATRALGVIRRSNGARYGRGMAITASMLSLFVVLLAIALALIGSTAIIREAAARDAPDDVIHRLMELDLAQRLYSQMRLDHSAPGAPCTSSVCDLLNATARYSPVEAETAAAISRADAGMSGRPAQAYGGYLFKIARGDGSASDGSAVNWAIFAWAPQRDRPTLMLDAAGTISVFHPTGEPPATLASAQTENWHASQVVSAR